jgi:hypothetical protein
MAKQGRALLARAGDGGTARRGGLGPIARQQIEDAVSSLNVVCSRWCLLFVLIRRERETWGVTRGYD